MPEEKDYPPEFLERVKAVTSKRPKTVIDHILKYGFITTEDLKNKYGYSHPPRAAMDVKDQGIPLVSFKVKAEDDGRTISAYKFGDLSQIKNDRLGGRKLFSKEFKATLVSKIGLKCAICIGVFEERYLQVDHRIPYQVSGDSDKDRDPNDYMLLDGSCNRAKSWSCEHCENFVKLKDPEVCKQCYWASPQEYKHIAMKQSRRVDVVWNEGETKNYDKLKQQADLKKQLMPEFVKDILRKHGEEL